MADQFTPRPLDDERHFRRGLYLLPTIFTVGNMFCGYACVVFAMRGELSTAAPFIGVAVVLDMLDGRIARMTKTSSAFGLRPARSSTKDSRTPVHSATPTAPSVQAVPAAAWPCWVPKKLRPFPAHSMKRVRLTCGMAKRSS